MGQSKDAPKPDASYLEAVDPELFAHSLVTILLKNTSLQPALVQDALTTWRERYMFDGERITLIDVLVENGHLERYKVPMLVKAAEYALKRREDKLFGKRAFRKGLITQTQLDDAMAFQKQLFKALYEVKRLETILVDDGFLDAEDAAEIWSEYEATKEKRRGVARPASLQRAAKSLGIDIGNVGLVQEPAKVATTSTSTSTSTAEAASEPDGPAVGEDGDSDSGDSVHGEDEDDFFAPIDGDVLGEEIKDDSVMDLDSLRPPTASPGLDRTQSATQTATVFDGAALPAEPLDEREAEADSGEGNENAGENGSSGRVEDAGEASADSNDHLGLDEIR